MNKSLHPAVRPVLALTPGWAASRRNRWIIHISLLIFDQILVFLSFALAYWMRYSFVWPHPFKWIIADVTIPNQVSFSAFLPTSVLLIGVLTILFETKGLYRLPRGSGLLDYAGIIVSSTITGIAVLIVLVFFYRPFYYSRLIFAFAGLNIVVLLCTMRITFLGIRHWYWAKGIGRERVLVIGGTGLGQQVMNSITAQPGLGYHLVGYLDNRPMIQNERANCIYRYAGTIDDLEHLVKNQNIHHVILALPFWEHSRLPRLAQVCRNLGITYHVAPDLYQLSFDRVDVLQISGVPLISPKEISLKGWNLALKRTIDIALVLFSLPITVPLALLLTCLIRLDSPGPALFRQIRIGKNGRPFPIYKFRTMVSDAESRKAELSALNEADGPLFKIRHDPRVTRVGRFLRSSSLDELPQLWSVLHGEMSLVGPRPALPEEVARYEPWHRRRLEVTPGMTCLAQALGRSDISFDEMVRLDIFYTENWSVGVDLRIMLMTIPAVLTGRGAY